MEAQTQRPDVVERERPWLRPAGIAALVAVAGILIGSIVRGTTLDGDSISEEMLDAASGSHDGQLLMSALLSGLGFALCSLPVTFLFIAARNRSDRVLRQVIGLTVVGGILIGAGQITGHFAFLDAADNFAAAEAERAAEADARADKGADAGGQGRQVGDVGGAEAQTGQGAAEQGADDKGTGERETTVEATTTGADEATTTGAEEESDEDAEDEADDRAEDAQNDASGASLSGWLQLAGWLAFAIGIFYTSLWAMRVGLLTRFWGTLGMAAAVVSVLIPPFVVILLLWLAVFGLLLLGFPFPGRPPAWATGTAIPWPRPGEPPADGGPDDGPGGPDSGGGPGTGPGGDPGAIEGEGRELDGGEPESPRKRKRRR